jgi:hypothetical protein
MQAVSRIRNSCRRCGHDNDRRGSNELDTVLGDPTVSFA